MLKNAVLRCLKWLGFSIATLIVIFAVLLSVARAVVPLLNGKRVFFEKWASNALHEPVHIGRVTIGWWSFDPTLRFNDVIVRDPKQSRSLLRVNQLSISINLIHSLINWKLLPGHLFISGTHVDLYQNQDGQFYVKGVVDLHDKRKQADVGYMKDLLLWMLTQSEVSLQYIDVNVHMVDGRLLPIKNLRLKVTNGVLQHQIAGVASLAQTIPTRFRFVMNLKSTDISKFSADLYFRANDLVFKQWVDNRYFRQYFKKLTLTHGVANVQSWLKWRDGQLIDYQGVLQSEKMGLGLTAKHKNIFINHLNANIYWQRYSDGWSFSANHIQLRMHGKTWPEHTFGMRVFSANKSQPAKIVFASQFIRLDDIHALAEDFGAWPKSIQKTYQELHPGGDLYNLGLVMTLQQGEPVFNRVRTEFHNLSFSSSGKLPAASGLTGFIDTTPKAGELKLASTRTSLNVRQLFNHPLFFDRLNVETSWQHTESGWMVNMSQLAFNNKMGSMQSRFTLAVPKAGSPIIHMKTKYQVMKVGLLKDYIPARLIKNKLRTWLTNAFLSGKVPEGKMELQGPVNDFPFDDRRGKFRLEAKIKDLDFKYAPDWPVIHHINGLLTFDDRSMHVKVDQGVTVGNSLNHVQAEIPDLQKSVLTVTGHSVSNLKNGENFLKASPLLVGKQLDVLGLSGPMNLNLKLIIPLYNNKKDAIASGDVTVNNGTMRLKTWNTELNHIRGAFHFVNNHLSATHVTALQYGLPVVVDVSTLDAKTALPILQVRVGGELNMASLQKQLKLPVLKFMQGTASYRALVQIRDENSPIGNSFSFASDLNGVSTSLPPPYSKTADQTKSFFMTMKTVHNKPLAVTLQYGTDFSAAANFTNSGKKLNFISGELLFGKGKAQLQESPGLLIDGSLKQVVWGHWKKYFDAHFRGLGGASKIPISQNTFIRSIKLQIGELSLSKHTLNDLYVNILPKSAGWSITVKNPIIAGNMFMPNNFHQRWYGHFGRLYLPNIKIEKKGDQQQKIDPHQIPPFDFTCDDFRYGAKELGQVHIHSTPTQAGLEINKLTVTNNLFGLSASGAWQDKQGQQKSTLHGQFGSKNLGGVLKNWGVTTALEGGDGSVNFALDWPGSPHEFSAAELNGSVSIKFRNGRVSQVTKNAESELGFGRLLNLFSLQTLPLLPVKLVQLAKKGFAFDLMKGSFALNHGNAITKNASIVGSVAWVRVNGNIGFVRKNYNLELNIVPNITSSLPLIVGIAGGPIAGAIAWIANKILAPQLGKAAQINYRITGPWTKPHIIKIPRSIETHTHGT
ncbi:YhdP family protein [Candidiatus Paracoxiella cheracis]|uniref:YhdP family protein n=1 Tax=Candidiatus Paracoxiella cheracis TaxID=3405120 RepID=UPI003BF5079B